MKKVTLVFVLFMMVCGALQAQQQKNKVLGYDIKRSDLCKMNSIHELYKIIDTSGAYSTYIIVSYNLEFGGNLLNSELDSQALFTSKMQEALCKSSTSKFHFVNVRAMAPENAIISLPEILLTITQ